MKMPKVDPIVVERFEEMLSKKFTPAANGVNVWLFASKFVSKMMAVQSSYYYKSGARKITDLINERYGKIDWMLMDKDIPLVLEVGSKSQFEIMLTKSGYIMYRFVPSGY
ncbi:hypothetical protein [Klebsiella phage Kpn6N]|jgi:hypothetical protein|uniref:Uncharacterized protein n=2 Tax=Jiaodavirus TaxID=1985325 RepID=A0A7T3N7H3_9CAUD|nr:hypothetical protein [Klebsiella variicola]PXM06450.1 hypothetical protein DMT40_17670 [Klebsiella variicola]QPX73716.1 hypothetical protein EVAN_73 [Klebsiella phage vB_KpnM_BovinicusUrsus]UJP30099.1 hypothetical protein [Klebsiella phage Kpn6N]UNY41266.1 hypothetical protein [Klebsiella phage KP185]